MLGILGLAPLLGSLLSGPAVANDAPLLPPGAADECDGFGRLGPWTVAGAWPQGVPGQIGILSCYLVRPPFQLTGVEGWYHPALSVEVYVRPEAATMQADWRDEVSRLRLDMARTPMGQILEETDERLAMTFEDPERQAFGIVVAGMVHRFRYHVSAEGLPDAAAARDLALRAETVALEIIGRWRGDEESWRVTVETATRPLQARVRVVATRGDPREDWRVRFLLEPDPRSSPGTLALSDAFARSPTVHWGPAMERPPAGCLEVIPGLEGDGSTAVLGPEVSVAADWRGPFGTPSPLGPGWSARIAYPLYHMRVRPCGAEDAPYVPYFLDMLQVHQRTAQGLAFEGVLTAKVEVRSTQGPDPNWREIATASASVAIDHVAVVTKVADLTGSVSDAEHPGVWMVPFDPGDGLSSIHRPAINRPPFDVRGLDTIRLEERSGGAYAGPGATRRDHVVLEWITPIRMSISVKQGQGDRTISVGPREIPEVASARWWTRAKEELGLAASGAGALLSAFQLAPTAGWVLAPVAAAAAAPAGAVAGLVLGVTSFGMGLYMYVYADTSNPFEFGMYLNSTAVIDIEDVVTVYLIEGTATLWDPRRGEAVALPAGHRLVVGVDGGLGPVTPFDTAGLSADLAAALHQLRSPEGGVETGPDEPGPTTALTLLRDDFDGENGGRGTFNHTAFANWTVTHGAVDLIGNGFYDSYPGNGLYLDLDGTRRQAATLSSRETFDLQPGRYLLEFELAPNPVDASANTVTVSLGTAFTESITRTRGDASGFERIQRTITVDRATTAQLVFAHAGGDDLGLYLDDVHFARLAPGGEPPPPPPPPLPPPPPPPPPPSDRALAVPGTHRGVLAATGPDAFTFTLDRATSLLATLRSGDFDTVLELYDAAGALIAVNDDFDGTDSRLEVNLAAGDYRLEVRSFSGGGAGGYALETDIALPPRPLPDLAVPGTHRGVLAASGPDVLTFTLDRAASLVATLRSGDFDPVLELYDAAGALIDSNDDFDGTDSRLRVDLPAGRYEFRVGSFWDDGSGAYALEVAEAETPPAVHVAVTGPGVLTGYLAMGATDSYHLTLTRPAAVTVEVRSLDFDTYLEAYDGSRLIDASDDFDGTDSRLALKLAAGEYRFEVTPYWGGEEGAYTIRFAW